MATEVQTAALAAIRTFRAWAYDATPTAPLPSRVVEAMWETAYNCLDDLVDSNDLRTAVEAVSAEDRLLENTPEERTEDVDYSQSAFWDRVEAKLE